MIASKPTYLSPDPNHNLPLHTKISVLPVPAPSSPGQSFHHLPLLLYTHKGGLLTTRLTSGIFEDYSLPPPKNYPFCIISISSSDSPTSCVVWKKNSEVLTLHKWRKWDGLFCSVKIHSAYLLYDNWYFKYIPVPLGLFTSEVGNAYSLVHQKWWNNWARVSLQSNHFSKRKLPPTATSAGQTHLMMHLR